jgi:hypothetical protein
MGPWGTTGRLGGRVLSWMAVGAIVPLLGVLSAPATLMPGRPRSDLAKHVWSYWHTLQNLGSWPTTMALGAPFGGEFYDVMLLPALLMAPVTAVLGPVFASNLWLWLSLVAVGSATAALAYRVVGTERSAVVAGLVAQLSPYLAGYPLGSGVHERLAIWVFPLVWWALLAWRDRQDRRALVAMAAGLFFATAGCQVYGVFALGMVLFGLPMWWPGGRRLLPPLVALGGPLVAAWALVRGPTISAISLVPQRGRLEMWPGMPHISQVPSMTLQDLLDPFAVARQHVIEGGDELFMLAYLGWGVLLAAIYGAVQRRGMTAGMVGVGLAMASLALGPAVLVGATLHWNPAHVALSLVLPAFRTIPVPWQAVGAAVPLLAVGVAASVDRFRWAGMPVSLVALIALERLVVVPVPLVLSTTDTTVPSVYGVVDGPVVEVPRVYRDTSLTPGEVFLAQLEHQQPIQLTINAGTVPFDFHLPTLRGVSTHWRRTGECWAAYGFRYVVVHRDWLSDSVDGNEQVARMTTALGAPVADDGVRAVFRLPEVSRQVTTHWTHNQTTIEVLLDRGLVGGPPPPLPHPYEACPTGR